jgi:hypothetical protein
VQWVKDNARSSPAKVADMRRQDAMLSKAIDLAGGWSKLSADFCSDPVTAADAAGRFMKAFGLACAEKDEARV